MHPYRLSSFGGEIADPAREAVFQAERLPDTLRHSRYFFLLAAFLNTLFFLSDWRFYGDPHFLVAIPARATVVATSLICFVLALRVAIFAALQRVIILWQAVCAIAIAFLVSSHSEVALFVTILLPSIYYLVLPTSFRTTVFAGAGCSLLMLAGYFLPGPPPATATGLILVMLTLNIALSLVVSRANRLRRLEWLATRAERLAKEELAKSRQTFESMFMAVPIPLVVTAAADGSVLNANDAAFAYFGTERAAFDLASVSTVYVDPAARGQFIETLRSDGKVAGFETRIRLAGGQERDVLLAATGLDVDGTPGIISGVVDITERKSAEELVRHAANHDALTGLPNRALFQSRLDEVLKAAEADGGRVALLLVDIDEFKEINDTLGHDAGDALLLQAAKRLRRTVPDDAMVARLGGDEFTVLMLGANRLADAERLAEALLEVLREPWSYRDINIAMRASIGVAAFPDHDRNPVELMKDGDLALYAAKERGRNRAAVYSPSMRQIVERRVQLAREVSEALATDRIVPFYQPRVSLTTGAVVGLEALARWRHPTRGLLTPAAFGAAFDHPELAGRLGERMVERVAADLRGWIDSGIDCGRVAVNLSAVEFREAGLAERILQALERWQVPPERWEVEVTETVFLGRSAEHVAAILQRFHDSGVRIALDDFGTGYASLTHLKQFPVDEIKIDQSFVRDIERDADDAAIASAVIDLGRSLGMEVIAEGVETVGQASYLRSKGCSQAQGYLFAKPMSAARIAWFLREAQPNLDVAPVSEIGLLRA